MDPQNQQPAPMMVEPKNKSVGPIIGLVVIIALILLGGIYFFTTRQTNETPIPVEPNNGIGNTPEDETVNSAAIEAQSSSDEAASIEADLNATDMNSLDANMNELQ